MTLGAGAGVGFVLKATVRGKGVGDGVGLPDVKLIAAEAEIAFIGL
jgi:hypothetical protein